MNLNDLANLGQIIGAVAVVISLFYVASQIRQNTNAVRSATAQAVQQAVHQALVEVLTSPELIALVTGAAGRPAAAAPPEATPVPAEGRPTLGRRLGQGSKPEREAD